jgi:phage shock protein PspC (stress-responsive transcriptional regulator)
MGEAWATEMGDEMDQQTPKRRLTRRTDDKMVAGVASGLAAYFDVEPVWIRLGFVASLVLGGSGAIAYLVLVMVIPKEGEPGPTPAAQTVERVATSLRDRPGWVGLAALVIGSLIVLERLLLWPNSVLWGVALIVVGVVLFRRHEEARAPAADGPADVSAPGTMLSSTVTTSAPSGGTATDEPIPVPDEPTRRVRAKRARSPLGWMTIGTVLMAEGVAASLDASGVLTVSPARYLALALTIVGVGMGVGAWWGRARGLMVIALLLIPLTFAASVVRVPLTGGIKSEVISPADAADFLPVYHLAAGEIIFDLRGVTPAELPVAITATVGAGTIQVLVPAGVSVHVRGKVGIGEIDLFGRVTSGTNLIAERTVEGLPGKGSYDLNLETSLGTVEVSRVERAPFPFLPEEAQ